MSRPEHLAPPEIFYNEEEAKKYTTSSRVIQIQSEMTERAIELLNLPERPCFLLDIGCGSGLSGEQISESGHYWTGVDISLDMLNIAKEREPEGDLILGDIGQGLPFRPASFDGAISISVIQWLCNADKASHKPYQRLAKFFQTLYICLARGARAVFQFYPENPTQIEMITNASMKAGFTGGLVVDFPNSSKKKKYFLCLFAGVIAGGAQLPKGLDDGDEPTSAKFTDERERNQRRGKHRKSVKDRDWILKKKETNRRRGKEVPEDSKYTGRKRGPRF